MSSPPFTKENHLSKVRLITYQKAADYRSSSLHFGTYRVHLVPGGGEGSSSGKEECCQASVPRDGCQVSNREDGYEVPSPQKGKYQVPSFECLAPVNVLPCLLSKGALPSLLKSYQRMLICLFRKCNIVIVEVVQLLKSLYDYEAFQGPPVFAQPLETEGELARVKKIVKVVEHEKENVEGFIKSASHRESVCFVALCAKHGDNLESMMQAAIDLYPENAKCREQKGPIMNILRKFKHEAQQNQFRLFLLQGLLKIDDPEMKRTLDCYYEESSTEEWEVASISSDESYEVVSVE
ncbi:hypothetical protein ACLB2K_063226 [Fragaria x ananassa]